MLWTNQQPDIYSKAKKRSKNTRCIEDVPAQVDHALKTWRTMKRTQRTCAWLQDGHDSARKQIQYNWPIPVEARRMRQDCLGSLLLDNPEDPPCCIQVPDRTKILIERHVIDYTGFIHGLKYMIGLRTYVIPQDLPQHSLLTNWPKASSTAVATHSEATLR